MHRKALALAALVLFAAGLVVGLMPLSADNTPCGSAFSGLDGWDQRAVECDDTRNTWRIPAIVLLVAGGIAAVAALAGSGTPQPGGGRRNQSWLQRRESKGHSIFEPRD